jgi:hypothetical protein
MTTEKYFAPGQRFIAFNKLLVFSISVLCQQSMYMLWVTVGTHEDNFIRH